MKIPFRITSNSIWYPCFFILLSIGVIPGFSGNRLLGGGVWIIAVGLLVIKIWENLKNKKDNLFNACIKKRPSQCLVMFILIICFLGTLAVNGIYILCVDRLGFTNNWKICDQNPAGAKAYIVWDEILKKKVVEFSGTGLENQYCFYPPQSMNWPVNSGFEMDWKIRYSEPLLIRIIVETNKGIRILQYSSSKKNKLGSKRVALQYGLGTKLITGKWHRIKRNIQADLARAQPDIIIKQIKQFTIRGSGRIDDINLVKSAGWIHLSRVLIISSLACYVFLFLCYMLFLNGENIKGYTGFVFILIIVHGISLWQMMDYDSAAVFLKYTVAADGLDGKKIASVFRNVTSYSPFAALTAVYFWGRIFTGRIHGKLKYAEAFVAGLATIGTLASGSRTGILSIFIGFFVLFWFISRERKILLVSLVISAIILLHIFGLHYSYLGKKLGKVFPYFNKLRNHEIVEMVDFIPDLTAGYSGKKVNRWIRIKEAYQFWKQQPFLGIGLGQYNIMGGHSWVGNVHNVFMNILCETGIFGFILLIYMIWWLFLRFRHSFMTAVLATILVTAMFENLFDHTMTYNMTCAWMFAREGNDMSTGQISAV